MLYDSFNGQYKIALYLLQDNYSAKPVNLSSSFFKRIVSVFCLSVPLISATFAQNNYPPADQVAKDFRVLLARPAAVPKASFRVLSTTDSLIIEKGSIYTEQHEKMPVLIYKPVAKAKTKFPAVIFLHGTGGNKEQGDLKAILLQLVKKGIMGVAIDARYHGERIRGGAHGAREYNIAAYQAWKNNNKEDHHYPFLYDTAYDLWRLVDYLVKRPDIKTDRIGMGGISMGGIETWLAASVDKRIRVAVLGIAVQSFKWSLANNQWQGRAGTIGAAHIRAAHDQGDTALNQNNVAVMWNKIIPGITGEFDCPSLIRLFAPRPLLILSNDKDPNNPYPGAQIAIVSAVQAFRSKDAIDKLNVQITKNKGHVFTEEHARLTVDWFSKWLID